jgi:hypothetical protein
MAAAAQPVASNANAAALAKAAGVSLDEWNKRVAALRDQGTSQREYNPWVLGDNADVGSVYLGQQADPQYSMLPPKRPLAYRTVTKTYLGHVYSISIPDYGKDWDVELHTDWGHTPTAEELSAARSGKKVPGMWVEVRDPHGNVVQRQDLDANQVDTMLRAKPTTPGSKAPAHEVHFTMDPYKYPNKPLSLDQPALLPTTDKPGLISDELKKLYDLPPEKMQHLKSELFLAGYYGPGATLDEINMHTITGMDIQAFGTIMATAAQYYAAALDGHGEKLTWQELLKRQASDPSAKHRGTKVPTIPLTSPALIAAQANATGTAILGRAPSAKDVQALVAMIHGHEMQWGKADQAGGGEGVVNATSGEAQQADIEQWMREKYPNEAMATDWGSAAQQWDELLKSTSPQPQIIGLPHA